jgi:hypothetical protein
VPRNDGENTNLSFFAHSSQHSCADVQNSAFSSNFDGEQGTTENPVFTGVSSNKHGAIAEKEMVPRARIELATRGFSVRNTSDVNPIESGISGHQEANPTANPTVDTTKTAHLDGIRAQLSGLSKDELISLLADTLAGKVDGGEQI